MVDVNVNQKVLTETIPQCLKGTYYWGETLYTNICSPDGDKYTIPWGGMDYAGSFCLLAIAVLFVSGVVCLILYFFAIVIGKVIDLIDEYRVERRWRRRNTDR